MADTTNTKQKIAILGGGVGSMVTAWQLTEAPGWQDKYDITVHQTGWRLGGKGASGRNLDCGSRIEEHGLHLWFGFYENAFHVISKVYAELATKNLAPGSPFQSWRDAFTPGSATTMMENTP